MILIPTIRHATNEDWGICERCIAGSALSALCVLCAECIAKRDEHFNRQVAMAKRSWEWRIRSWLCAWLKPSLKFN